MMKAQAMPKPSREEGKPSNPIGRRASITRTAMEKARIAMGHAAGGGRRGAARPSHLTATDS